MARLNKLAGRLPGALGPAEFVFPFISSLAGAEVKRMVLRAQGAHALKCAGSRRNGLPECLLQHFGNPLCIWWNLSVVSKAHPAASVSLFLGSRVREQPPRCIPAGYYVFAWVTLHQRLWDKQISKLSISSVCSYLPVTYTVTSLHWGTTGFIFISPVWGNEVSFFLFFNWGIGTEGNRTTLRGGRGVHFPSVTDQSSASFHLRFIRSFPEGFKTLFIIGNILSCA